MAGRLPALCMKRSHLGRLSRIGCGDFRLSAKDSIAPYGWGKFSPVDEGQSSGDRCCKWFSTVVESLEPVNGKAGLGPVIAVGLSGGVDSSIAALLLKRQGYRVFGVYMRNWDSSDEVGGTACSAERDYEDARLVAKQLGIELYEVDNQKRYWTDVFESFTSDFSTGLTPNPDLACNRYIKFDALLEQAKQLGADKLATGHYARLGLSRDGQQFQLLRGIDHDKDQSYFLASVAGSALQSVMFPLGSLIKSDVRKLAATEGLITAQKRSSAGICFVGRRNFSDFISEYVDMKPGPFIAVNSGAEIGTHDGIPSYTHGQRARIGGQPEAWYVVGKDVPNNSVFVAAGPEHPALFCTTAVADGLSWISGALPAELAEGRVLKCLYKARYRQPVEECTVCLASADSEEALREGMGIAFTNSRKFLPSSLCRLQSVAMQGEQLQIKFLNPARAITPGQALVLYDGQVCLGAARLLHPGPSVFEEDFEHEHGQGQGQVASSTQRSELVHLH
ncbi:hypothetical protein MPTK1_5g22570 [Marchantia polymorpha subsp. ruderalis]|uniref:tRNA-5-taurinomethyluridine 2-sulfurtransferase n=1 Tax=Marchantia polymorpha subsp. ruderalis TaxID=1480154 RepID=A0AAF6BL64_MARPO|nr:hypothetical protein Mp_5g22570 [Marchantia polymorpha subsp. ruderalis]